MLFKNIVVVMNNGEKILLGSIEDDSEKSFISRFFNNTFPDATKSCWNFSYSDKVVINSKFISTINYDIEEKK